MHAVWLESFMAGQQIKIAWSVRSPRFSEPAKLLRSKASGKQQ
jgi:hypothetical protein